MTALSLWKPAGRMDVVELEHGFFLIRLSLKEDVETVLKKGPWFLGDHFLSVRPWEPDFKPESAKVSSIAVWVRLSGLPIEYYNAKALQHIGKAIGNVLRIDTFTATESRGKFARLCIQVDVDKPLITTVMIGKLQQTVTYEGIHNLCFECGRMGHKREACPFVIRPVPPCEEEEKGGAGDRGASTHVVHDPDTAERNLGPHGKDNAVREDVHEGSYGPWMVVARRKKELKIQRSGGSLPGHGFAMEQRSNGQRKNWAGVEMKEDSNGLSREAKRKLAPLRILDKAQLEQALQKIGKEAHVGSTHNAGKKVFMPKDTQGRKSGSVKGMKAEARAKGGCNFVIGAAGEDKSKVRSPASKMCQVGAVAGAELRRSAVPSLDKDKEFQFAAVDDSETGQV